MGKEICNEGWMLRKLTRPLQRGEVLGGNVDLLMLAVNRPLAVGQVVAFRRRCIVLQELTRDEYVIARRVANKLCEAHGARPVRWYGAGPTADELEKLGEPEDPPDSCCYYYQLQALDQRGLAGFASRTGVV